MTSKVLIIALVMFFGAPGSSSGYETFATKGSLFTKESILKRRIVLTSILTALSGKFTFFNILATTPN
ncbi:hypothetical protein LKM2_3492 [Leptospira kirschneri serovar Mozdok]|nr:hypothetical protein [Leptospira kirschneri serovar Mozdok]